MTTSYPNDITRQQSELIRPDLEATRRRTRPRQVDLYDVFNALLFYGRVPNGISYPTIFRIGKPFMGMVGINQRTRIYAIRFDLKKLSLKVDDTWAIRYRF